MRHKALAALLALTLGACGGGGLSLTEYAAEVENLTQTLYGRLDEIVITTGSPSVEDVQFVYTELAIAYRGLLDGLQAIDPPREAAELHDVSLDIVGRLTATQEALAGRADAVERQDQLSLLFDSPEARAADAVQQEIIAFCQGAQAQFDATADREALVGMPWIPSELQEVVQVVFGCGTEGPGGGS